MPADHYIMDADMKKVADAIRTKGQTTAPLTFPDGMVQAVNGIQAGGGTEIEDGIIKRSIEEYTNDRVTFIGQEALSYCDNIKSVSFPNVTRTSQAAVSNCRLLQKIDFPKLGYVGSYTFSMCDALTTADLPKARDIGSGAFNQCSKLATVNLPLAQIIESSAFIGCAFTTLDLPKVTLIQTSAMMNCQNLTVIKLGVNQIVSLGRSVLSGSDKAQIYVPNNLVEQYKVATNWSQYASRIHPLSEAPQ